MDERVEGVVSGERVVVLERDHVAERRHVVENEQQERGGRKEFIYFDETEQAQP